MGSLSLLKPFIGLVGLALIGFLLGYIYEWANLIKLNWWYFPKDRFLFFKGKQGCALAVSVLWALVPVIISLLQNFGIIWTI